jgi:hypothetical protein
LRLGFSGPACGGDARSDGERGSIVNMAPFYSRDALTPGVPRAPTLPILPA